MEVIIVLILILLNGVFAMAEIAILSIKKTRLQQLANQGNKSAKVALDLVNNPNKFLSTVQIGITLIGIIAGAFGGATLSEGLSRSLQTIPLLKPYSDIVAFGLVVITITYLSLIIGELVPKRIGLSNPEKMALLLAIPMQILSSISAPFVTLLSFSTEWVIRLLRIVPNEEISVSEEEVRMLLQEGTRSGVFEHAERDIVERTFKLSDRKVNSLMTNRKDITWLDIDSSFTTIKNKITKDPHPLYPVCKNNLDKVIGMVRTEEVLTNYLTDEKIDISKCIYKPLFIPSNMEALKVLELFKKSGIHIAIVVDEYGAVEGLLSLTDILEAIVGDIPSIDEFDEKEIMKRDETSWLVDGLISLEEFREHFHIRKLPSEKAGIFHTLGGFVMHHLGRIPVPGDGFEWENYRFEVMDMDGNRVDKILLIKENK